ncbi:MAG TPA: bifunctional 4-hydroxy-2-oxoglutarate aldolase/2-dehydro-3-deoxy-phosphogluconate aldolase [Pirellulales bacterium]|jgi:2-dehydro-3-deoxyphosphogluconate aldolase/(4S)-4-hydroxy-2-oxoglutarate aldolase
MPVVAVVRAASGEQLVDVAEALAAGGIDAVEITFTVPQAHRVIEKVAAKLGGRVLLGAGTVLDAETARIALLSGAEFVVSPTLDLRVIEICRRYGKLVMPGAFSPTEVLAAWQAGADIVKVFPCDVLGPAYLKALAGPLPQIRLMPSGGVNLDTIGAFLQAGAFALGVGGALVDAKLIEAGNFTEIQARAKRFADAVRQLRRT